MQIWANQYIYQSTPWGFPSAKNGKRVILNAAHIASKVGSGAQFNHVAGFLLAPIPIKIGQRCGRGQQRLRLGCGQVAFQRHKNILPNGVFVGVVKNFLRGLRYQPRPIAILFRFHFLIESGCQFFCVQNNYLLLNSAGGDGPACLLSFILAVLRYRNKRRYLAPLSF